MRLAMYFLFFVGALIVVNPTIAHSQLFSNNEPSEVEVEFGIIGNLPRGASISRFDYEVFSDDARGTGRISVSGTYFLDRDYYLVSRGPNEIISRIPSRYNATVSKFMGFWKSVAPKYGGHRLAFREASKSWSAGKELKFSGDISYIRGVDGYRFLPGGLTREEPQGGPDFGDAYLVNSEVFSEIERDFLNYLSAESDQLKEIEAWVQQMMAGRSFTITYENSKISEIRIDDKLSIFDPDENRNFGMVRYAAPATKKDTATKARSLNNWVGAAKGSVSEMVVWGSARALESGEWVLLLNLGTKQEYEDGVDWKYGYRWDASRGIFAGMNYDRNTFIPCAACGDLSSGTNSGMESKGDMRAISTAVQIVGSYVMRGTTGTVTDYQGAVEIIGSTQSGNLNIHWSYGNSSYSGIGKLMNGALEVKWLGDSVPMYLPRVYRMRETGELIGDWSSGSGKEVLTPRSSVSKSARHEEHEQPIGALEELIGSYVVGGLSGTGSTYGGLARISASGHDGALSFRWTLGQTSYSGIGRLEDGRLEVDWAGDSIPVYLPRVYRMRKTGELIGDWESGSGQEVLTRTTVSADVSAVKPEVQVDNAPETSEPMVPSWREVLGQSTWSGTVRQPSSSQSYSIVVSIKSGAIEVDYPELDCSGAWSFAAELQPGQWRFNESISSGRNRCSDGGDVVLRLNADGTMAFEWFRKDREVVEAWATLGGSTSP